MGADQLQEENLGEMRKPFSEDSEENCWKLWRPPPIHTSPLTALFSGREIPVGSEKQTARKIQRQKHSNV